MPYAVQAVMSCSVLRGSRGDVRVACCMTTSAWTFLQLIAEMLAPLFAAVVPPM